MHMKIFAKLGLFISITCLSVTAHAQQSTDVNGTWQIVAYRFGEGISVGPREAKQFLRTKIRFSADRATSGRDVCNQPGYQSERIKADEFATRFRTSLKAIGIKAKEVEVIEVQCNGSTWIVPGSLLIVSNGQMLTLWDGVFFVLKKAT